MVFGFFAHDEGVDVESAGSRGVHDGGGHGVGSHRQSADGVGHARAEARLLEHVEHDMPHKRAGLMVKRGAAHVHVIRRLLAGCQRKVPALDGQRADQFNESPAKRIVHGLKCSGAELVNFKLVLSSFDKSNLFKYYGCI